MAEVFDAKTTAIGHVKINWAVDGEMATSLGEISMTVGK
jgi:hypothetical protein